MSAAKTAKPVKKAKRTVLQGRQAAKSAAPGGYQITGRGRLNLTDFAARVGAKPGDRFRLVQPRGKTDTWHLVPVEE